MRVNDTEVQMSNYSEFKSEVRKHGLSVNNFYEKEATHGKIVSESPNNVDQERRGKRRLTRFITKVD